MIAAVEAPWTDGGSRASEERRGGQLRFQFGRSATSLRGRTTPGPVHLTRSPKPRRWPGQSSRKTSRIVITGGPLFVHLEGQSPTRFHPHVRESAAQAF